MAVDNTEGYESPRTSRHGGPGTWWAGCLRLFRRWGSHPRHSAGTSPMTADEMTWGNEHGAA